MTATDTATSGGPLAGIRVIELAGMGPAPFAAMVLADMGADVVRIDSPTMDEDGRRRAGINPLNRGRRSVLLNLKDPDDLGRARDLIADADVLIEGFRPGVCERLGLDPAQLVEEFPRLVVGRVSGWGQDGPDKTAACHDINILAMTGLLDTIGTATSGPVAPPMYLADFGGGGMVFVYGVLSALVERSMSGRGQVIDASMAEGTSLLSVVTRALMQRGDWYGDRGTNVLDTGAPYYRLYETRDGRHLAVGAIEPQFYAAFVGALGLDLAALPDRHDRAHWAGLADTFAPIVAERELADWVEVFATVDACVSPVLTMDEAAQNRQFVAREAFTEVNGIVTPSPTPKFSRTPAPALRPIPAHGEHSDEILGALR